jgi:hypothetical protein
MKRLRFGVYSSLMLMLVAWASLVSGQAQKAASAPEPPAAGAAAANPLKIALLKWYPVNTTTSFTVGNQPYGVCFDGANIWSANYGELP